MDIRKQFYQIALLLLTGSIALAAGKKPQNLQLLKFESVDETKRYMKVLAKDLDVKCKFCHNLDNFADDSNDHKKIARSMMKMTMDLNKEFFTWKDARQVTCWTCHQGQKEPPKKK